MGATAQSCPPFGAAQAGINRAAPRIIRPERVAAGIDWTAAGPWRRLCRLVATGIGIAAALSGDLAMQSAYKSATDISRLQSKLAPFRPTTTKETHGPQRELFRRAS